MEAPEPTRLTPQVGSVAPADATLLEQLNAFAPLLEGIMVPTHELEALIKSASLLFERERESLTHSEELALAEIVVQIEDALNEFAPPFCYFGQHRNDGDHGFWPAIHEIESGNVDGVLKVGDVPSYLLHVNDHGNATLYEIALKEIWSVV